MAQQFQRIQSKTMALSGTMFLAFTPKELGMIVVFIVRGIERRKAIRAMPRYSRRHHSDYAGFYDELREAIIDESDTKFR